LFELSTFYRVYRIIRDLSAISILLSYDPFYDFMKAEIDRSKSDNNTARRASLIRFPVLVLETFFARELSSASRMQRGVRVIFNIADDNS